MKNKRPYFLLMILGLIVACLGLLSVLVPESACGADLSAELSAAQAQVRKLQEEDAIQVREDEQRLQRYYQTLERLRQIQNELAASSTKHSELIQLKRAIIAEQLKTAQQRVVRLKEQIRVQNQKQD